jgi:N-acetylmuramoyl-L-alanine amidase
MRYSLKGVAINWEVNMLQGSKFTRALAVASVCSLMTAGFTSHAAANSLELGNSGRIAKGEQGEMLSEVTAMVLESHTEQTIQLVKEAKEAFLKQQEKIVAERIRQEEEAKKAAEEAERRQEMRAQSDVQLLAALIFCEAGNQPYEGQVAVGAVVLNRVQSSVYPNSISEVIYQSGQFGPAMTGWLDRVLSTGGYTSAAMEAAIDALAGVNPIGSCLYFGNGNYGMKIGDHYFH